VNELVQLGRSRRIVPDPEAWPVTPIPAQHRNLGPTPATRRQAFIAHLDGLLAGVEGPAQRGEITHYELSAEVERLSIQGCIGCRGACCQTGSTHAWLTLKDVRRLQEAQGNPSAEEFRNGYLAHLDGPRYLESCVFHGEQGCVLPREMRSERCNAHWCGELRQLQRSQVAGTPPRAFMVWPRADGGVTGAYVEPDRARVVLPCPTGSSRG
jgi:hypothetical protein